MKVKKGDTVLVISGKDRAKKGKVVRVFPKINRIIVEGVNLRKKHVKPKRSGEKGQIVSLPLPLYVSTVKIICPRCGKATRIGYKMEAGKKFRVCKKCGGEL
jgi:large subunit ribosomal protein L24